MSNNLMEVFTDYYERLCHSIPYDDLVVSLIDQQVLTMEEAQKVPVSKAARNACESAEYLLEVHVHKPLSNGDKQIFHKLLLCMKKSDKCAQLAAEIERRIANIDETDGPLVTKPAATKEPTTVEPLRTESNKHVEVTEQPKLAGELLCTLSCYSGVGSFTYKIHRRYFEYGNLPTQISNFWINFYLISKFLPLMSKFLSWKLRSCSLSCSIFCALGGCIQSLDWTTGLLDSVFFVCFSF